jgi:hypothetical protein
MRAISRGIGGEDELSGLERRGAVKTSKAFTAMRSTSRTRASR